VRNLLGVFLVLFSMNAFAASTQYTDVSAAERTEFMKSTVRFLTFYKSAVSVLDYNLRENIPSSSTTTQPIKTLQLDTQKWASYEVLVNEVQHIVLSGKYYAGIQFSHDRGQQSLNDLAKEICTAEHLQWALTMVENEDLSNKTLNREFIVEEYTPDTSLTVIIPSLSRTNCAVVATSKHGIVSYVDRCTN
jgi:hypothetical protein